MARMLLNILAISAVGIIALYPGFAKQDATEVVYAFFYFTRTKRDF